MNFAGHAIRTEVSDGAGSQFVGQVNPNFHPSNFDGSAGGHGHAYQGGMLGHHHQGERLYTDGQGMSPMIGNTRGLMPGK